MTTLVMLVKDTNDVHCSWCVGTPLVAISGETKDMEVKVAAALHGHRCCRCCQIRCLNRTSVRRSQAHLFTSRRSRGHPGQLDCLCNCRLECSHRSSLFVWVFLGTVLAVWHVLLSPPPRRRTTRAKVGGVPGFVLKQEVCWCGRVMMVPLICSPH